MTARKGSTPSKWNHEWTADSREVAAQHGLLVVEPDEHTLQLDIDKVEDLDVMNRQLSLMESTKMVTLVRKTVSGSRSGNWHVTIVVEQKLTPLLRIALQACLGSDRAREMYSICRHLNGDQSPTLFFEEP